MEAESGKIAVARKASGKRISQHTRSEQAWEEGGVRTTNVF
jgi:hypothetical protein